ncbi:alpha/beta hydrolase [Sphingomonas japonica]|uniref:Polyhydroxyalkanoate synthase n=2 Tax=Sphingomonas japonica TaxID=511662 RepID=A0ABX0U1R6_9SPHN|nr:polyhydroxyalkanoate synthase [Sphingomonas japonica]
MPHAAPAEIAARHGRARVIDYGGSGRPTLVVPSLINPPIVLDLAPETSLLRWLAKRGVRPLLLDWGIPEPADAAMTMADHVGDLLLPLLRSIGSGALLAGYCLGGTLALAAAQHVPVAGLALIATPWRFSGFGRAARADIAALWATARPACEAIGAVPVEVLQSGFWRLDPARTIGKYERFAALDPASAEARAFVALEDWANGGAPLTLAAGRDLFERFVADDAPGSGGWRVGGIAIDPASLSCPIRQFVSAHDRIVPAATAAPVGDTTTLSAGHVGMIVGSRARTQLWEPLARWCDPLAAPRSTPSCAGETLP